MPRGKATLVALTVLASLALALPASSSAARSSFPQGFYGVNYSGNVELLSAGAQGKLWDTLAMGGSESVRVLFNWDLAERVKGQYNWSRIDALVRNAAKRHMSILAVVEYAPAWAKIYPKNVASPPKDSAFGSYTAFLRAAINRYGSNGTFWNQLDNLTLPKTPVLDWEIWNEIEIGFHWYRGPNKPPWRAVDAQRYVRLLKPSYATVHATDPHARVVLAPLSIDSWKNLKKLYDWTEVEGKFDVAAVQAYSGTADYIPTILKNFRNVLNTHGAGSRPLYVTEMTWPAAKGIAHPHYTTGYMSGFLTNQPTAAKRLTKGYALLRDPTRRAQLKLQRVFWYTGVSAYRSKDEFQYSGLLNYQNDKVLAYPVYFAYQKSASSAEGCVKNAAGLCK